MKKLVIVTFLSILSIAGSSVFSDVITLPGGAAYNPVALPDPLAYNPQGQNIIEITGVKYYITQRRMIKFKTSKADTVVLYQPEEKAILPAVGANTTRKLSVPKN